MANRLYKVLLCLGMDLSGIVLRGVLKPISFSVYTVRVKKRSIRNRVKELNCRSVKSISVGIIWID